jgi:hypothetical protein
MRFNPTLSRRALGGALLGLAFLVPSGCGGKGQVPVHGKLVYADTDEPVTELKGFEVMFTSEPLHVSARGIVQPDGSFQLGTTKENDGTAPGEYIVTLTQPFRQAERAYLGDRVVDQDYENPSKSDLRAEVKKGDKNEFIFKLRRIGKKAN